MSFLAVLLALICEQLKPLPHGNAAHARRESRNKMIQILTSSSRLRGRACRRLAKGLLKECHGIM